MRSRSWLFALPFLAMAPTVRADPPRTLPYGVTFTPLQSRRVARPSATVSTHRAMPQPPALVSSPAACHVDGTPTALDLAAPHDRAMQVRLAHRAGTTVALVTLARPPAPRQIREGLVFVESRLVVFAPTRVPRVVAAPGFGPDASLALITDDAVWVLGHERVDVHATAGAMALPLRLARLDLTGRVRGEVRTLDDTTGASVDSPWFIEDGRASVVLGRANEDGTGVVEALRSFRVDGTADGTSLEITRAQSDDSLGRFRMALGRGHEPGARRMVWTVGDGADAGVWTREIDREGVLSAPDRVADRAAWGAEIAGDGSGVFFRRGGERGIATHAWLQAWGAPSPVSIGEGWDAVIGWSGARLFALADVDEGHAALTTATVGAPDPAPIDGLDDTARSDLAESPDQDVVGTDDGGALAVWFAERDGVRALVFARVLCERP